MLNWHSLQRRTVLNNGNALHHLAMCYIAKRLANSVPGGLLTAADLREASLRSSENLSVPRYLLARDEIGWQIYFSSPHSYIGQWEDLDRGYSWGQEPLDQGFVPLLQVAQAIYSDCSGFIQQGAQVTVGGHGPFAGAAYFLAREFHLHLRNVAGVTLSSMPKCLTTPQVRLFEAFTWRGRQVEHCNDFNVVMPHALKLRGPDHAGRTGYFGDVRRPMFRLGTVKSLGSRNGIPIDNDHAVPWVATWGPPRGTLLDAMRDMPAEYVDRGLAEAYIRTLWEAFTDEDERDVGPWRTFLANNGLSLPALRSDV